MTVSAEGIQHFLISINKHTVVIYKNMLPHLFAVWLSIFVIGTLFEIAFALVWTISFTPYCINSLKMELYEQIVVAQ